MSQDLTKKKFIPGSLRGPRTARTVLLRMAADDARAERIRETYLARKAEDPKRFTWARIASFVGTTERAAQEWQKTGGIDYDNAQKLAECLGVDFDWLWRGPKEGETPDPFVGAAREDQVNDGFDEFRQYVRDIRRDLAENQRMLEDARSERRRIEGLLQTQETILARIEMLATGLPDSRRLEGFVELLAGWEERVRLEEAARQAAASSPRPAPSTAAEGGRRESA